MWAGTERPAGPSHLPLLPLGELRRRCSHADPSWPESRLRAVSQLSPWTLCVGAPTAPSPLSSIQSSALPSQAYEGRLPVLPSSLSDRERQWEQKAFVLYSQSRRRPVYGNVRIASGSPFLSSLTT